tara:strand:+ start:3446 stop:3673 length:228 start_codon:yes stop_codon:yes gene_type:complete
MSFPQILFHRYLFYFFWIIPFLGNGIISFLNNIGLLIRAKEYFYGMPHHDLKVVNGSSLFILEKENSSIFNFVLG